MARRKEKLYTVFMYSKIRSYKAQGGCPMTEQPVGQRVAVVLLRNRGAKLSYAQLDAAEPLIGYIRHVDGYGATSGMAFRTHSMLQLKGDAHALGEIAHLNNPCLVDWNQDGLIYEGWVLERDPADEKMHQVVQMWWIRNLEAMPAKPEIRRKTRPQR